MIVQKVSEWSHRQGETRSRQRNNIALHPKESQQQVRSVSGPVVQLGVLQPAGDMSCGGSREKHWHEPEVETALLDELILDLFVDVFGVQTVLIRPVSLHIRFVLRTDNHNDQHGFIVQKAVHPLGGVHAPNGAIEDVNRWLESIGKEELSEGNHVFGSINRIGDENSFTLLREADGSNLSRIHWSTQLDFPHYPVSGLETLGQPCFMWKLTWRDVPGATSSQIWKLTLPTTSHCCTVTQRQI